MSRVSLIQIIVLKHIPFHLQRVINYLHNMSTDNLHLEI
uniref:Uncharacterized protein n=1 Tax=Rhizophora mucronata TaxID=61149 RepID=A0A2P2QQL8_RHIMU